MNIYRALCAGLLLALFSVHAEATPFNTLSMDVGVCDPNNPTNCIKPDSSGNVPITGSITATLGGFHEESVLTPITATTGGVSSSAFTAGKTVVVTNAGATNIAYCQLGASSTTSGQPIAPNGGWFAFTSTSETQVTCATSTSTTTINFSVGTGLPTGTGGGGGSGGGGGAITAASGSYASGALSSGSIASGAYASGAVGSGAVASGAYSAGSFAAGALAAGAFASGAGVDGWDLTQGTKSDALCTVPTSATACSVVAILKALTNQVASAIPAGTNTIGSVKQTDGTTVVVTDPCQGSTKTYAPITATTSLVKVIATGVSAKKIYICQIILNTTAANNVAVFEATTATTCATSPVAVYGAGTSVATAANGFPFPANGGVAMGMGGFSIAQTTVNNNDLCIGTSAATPLTGGIMYVTQ